MDTSRRLPSHRGLTAPHPNPLSDLKLVKSCGSEVSLHRYAGRWVVIRLTEQPPDPARAIGNLPSADIAPLNVVDGPVSGVASEVPMLFDPAHELARRFPALDCPATFVIDPKGHLIAILDDQGWPQFLEELTRQSGRASAHGAIDQRDLRR